MTPEQKKQHDELLALQTKLHQDWLKHPVTVEFCKILVARGNKQVKDLQDGILTESNEKKEIGYRASISAIKAIEAIVTLTPTFIQELNKLTPNT